jgi:dihydrofolate reductase
MMISMVLASDEKGAIGYKGDMPWGRSMKSDLAHFKQITEGKIIIMGRKTFESLPKILPNRYHVVLTSDTSWSYDSPHVGVFHDLDALIQYASRLGKEKEVVVIGGATIYEAFFPHVSKVHLTKIFAQFQADTYFNPTKFNSGWQKEAQKKQKSDADNAFDYQFITYTRR